MPPATPLSVPSPSAQPIPRAAEVRRWFYQNTTVGKTERFRRIDRYEAFFRGSQYEHLKTDWWGKNADYTETISPEVLVPYGFVQPAVGLDVRSKRPTAPTQVCRAVVDRFTGLLFGEKRKPKVIVENDADTEDFMHAVMDQSLFWSRWRQARSVGGACGAVLVTAHVRNGEFGLEIHNPKETTVLWQDRRGLIPEAVLKMYEYPVEEQLVDPRTNERVGTRISMYLYRRIISAYEDIVFKPVRVEPDFSGLDWVPEDGGAIQHDLGFFPGVWVQNRAVLDDIDGDPDCHGGWQMVDTMDRIIAQMNKGILLNLDPTLVLNYDQKEIEAGGGIRTGSDHALSMGKSGSAKYLEISGSGVSVATQLYEVLKKNFFDLVRCIMADPERLAGSAQSALAIELLYQPMLEAADDLRAQYGEMGVLRLLRIIDKMARRLDEQGKGVKLPPKVIKEPDGSTRLENQKLGQGGYIRLLWPPYFAPTEVDNQQRITNAVAAKAGGLVDQATAVRHVSEIFGVEDVDAALEVIKQEQSAEMEKALGSLGGDMGEM